MTENTLNEIIHAPNRLRICALLSGPLELQFRVLKNELDVSNSVLSKHLKVLEHAGYIVIHKRKEFGGDRTWVSLSSKGRKAFHAHIDALREVVNL